MTLVSAWIRSTPSSEELIVASDSRVTGGILLDHAPKIFRLDRGDAVLAYCGPTLVAYPILLQIKSSLDAHQETRNRIIDLVHLKSHIEKTIERLRLPIKDLPCKDDTNRSFKFLLAGYSWKTNTFRVWVFRYDLQLGQFNAYAMPSSHRFVFMSDQEGNERRATAHLMRHISTKSNGTSSSSLDWAPLSILLDVINDPAVLDVGGSPQLVKIYRHANTLPINFLWREAEKVGSVVKPLFQVTHLGRPLLDYEKTRFLTLDSQTWELIEPWRIRERLAQYNSVAEGEAKAALVRALLRAIADVRDTKALQQNLTEMSSRRCSFQEMQAVIHAYHVMRAARQAYAP